MSEENKNPKKYILTALIYNGYLDVFKHENIVTKL